MYSAILYRIPPASVQKRSLCRTRYLPSSVIIPHWIITRIRAEKPNVQRYPVQDWPRLRTKTVIMPYYFGFLPYSEIIPHWIITRIRAERPNPVQDTPASVQKRSLCRTRYLPYSVIIPHWIITRIRAERPNVQHPLRLA